MTHGTSSTDNITTTFDGEIIYGGDGNDTLSSTHNSTTLYGLNDDDLLTSSLIYTVPSAAFSYDGKITQSGNDGQDTLQADISIDGDFAATATALQYGGDGNDVIRSTASVLMTGDAFILQKIHGGGGDDDIVVNDPAQAQGADGFAQTQSIVDIHGGNGDDTITSHAVTGPGTDFTTATNTIKGGLGNDLISATAITNAAENAFSRNTLFGGSGDDTLYSTVEGSAIGLPTFVSDNIRGGGGNDLMTSSMTASDFEDNTVTAAFDGMSGNDTIVSDISVQGGAVTLNGSLEGRSGDDSLHATLNLDITNAFFTTTHHDVTMALDGGAGSDDLSLTVNVATYDPTATDVWSLSLDGGSGNDTLTLSITNGVDAALQANGGSGDDVIVASGGQTNQLSGSYGNDSITGGTGSDMIDGGNGLDTIEGGLGDDWLSGGTQADTFIFHDGTDEGTDHITDWEAGGDILEFAGLADTGAAGLADDIDAVSTITDDGTDVTLALDWGTTLVFEGVGTGSVSSIADLMSDPLNQIA